MQIHEPVGLLMDEAVQRVQLAHLGHILVVALPARGYPLPHATLVGVAQRGFVLAVAVQKGAQPGFEGEMLDNGGLKILLDGFGGHITKVRIWAAGGRRHCAGAE